MVNLSYTPLQTKTSVSGLCILYIIFSDFLISVKVINEVFIDNTFIKWYNVII